MKHITSILCATALVAFTNITIADTLTLNGDTTGLPTFNRPVGEVDYPLTPAQVTLSDLADDVEYFAQPFNVSITGNYDFTASSTVFDTYIVLYNAGGFNPVASTLNVEALNDDGGLTGIALTQGVTYTFVTTGFSNDDQGAFTSSITGPGTVTAVPEPGSATIFAVLTGAAALYFVRFRAQKNV